MKNQELKRQECDVELFKPPMDQLTDPKVSDQIHMPYIYIQNHETKIK